MTEEGVLRDGKWEGELFGGIVRIPCQTWCKSQPVRQEDKQTDGHRDWVRAGSKWDGSIPADIVAGACRQLFFHVVRLVAPLNRRAGGGLSVAAVVLDGDWNTHAHGHTDIISRSITSLTNERTRRRAHVDCDARQRWRVTRSPRAPATPPPTLASFRTTSLFITCLATRQLRMAVM